MNRRHLIAIAFGTILAVATSGTASGADFPAGSPKFHTSHAAALKAGKESGKPVVMIFSASWCPPCQANKKNVYPSKEVKAHHDKFVWAYLDADDKANHPAMEKAGVTGIPHIEIIDKSGKTIGQSVGGTSPAEFASTLEAAAKQAAK